MFVSTTFPTQKNIISNHKMTKNNKSF